MLGYGGRSFIKKRRDFYLKYKGALLCHAYNTFLAVALQKGLHFFVFCSIKYSYDGTPLENSPWRKLYLLGTFMMIITFFVSNLSDDFFVDDSALLFWFISGAAISLRRG